MKIDKHFWLNILAGLVILAYAVLVVATAVVDVWVFLFFVLHWYVAVFLQSFFLHRYAAHAMFTMHRWWEKFFHILTYVIHGSSYLVPSAYAILHRLHHKFSDTIDDPHSPIFFKDIFTLMHKTKWIYMQILANASAYTTQFKANYPIWKWFDARGNSWISRILRGVLYIGIYMLLGASWWMYFLLPIHFLMNPVHGAIVNRFGHMAGYINYKLGDHSKNTLPIDILTVGELFQNNHHAQWTNPKFARKWREIDPTYVVMKFLARCRIIRFTWVK